MDLSHLDNKGTARMVDVTEKQSTAREAVAAGEIWMLPQTLDLIQSNGVPKGDVLATARLAGIMGAKRTPDLIPLCHPLSITLAEVEFSFHEDQPMVQIVSRVRTNGTTGVEMEALTAVGVAALTIYDMCKAVDHGMRIQNIRLIRKSGGKRGPLVLEELG